MHKFFVQNFGCRATQADGAALESLLAAAGLEPGGAAHAADLVVLNTCTVTSAADDDVRKSIHRVHRENPAARILVTGCYAQRSPEELARIPGVTWVVGNTHKTAIAGIVQSAEATVGAPYHGQIHVGDILEARDFLSSPVEDSAGDRARPNLKIQDGCNNVCTFCIIPSVRGRSRSMPALEVVAQVRALARDYREVVLTGVNLGRWGRDPQTPEDRRMRLSGLLRLLLRETPVERLRVSSVEPMDFSGDLIELMAGEPRICPHVHMPLQSGSDAVLKRMKRRYRARHYEDRLTKASAKLPEAAFGADVMTGFPGETEAEFRETHDFIARLPFTYLHVFTYSERPGTPAAAWPQTPHPVRKERTRALRALAEEKNRAFRARFVGRPLEVVTLGGARALSGNYIPVELAHPREANLLLTVRAGGLTANGAREASVLPLLA
jgi:threonylcarbamoyladenosine tRNA methylthiotransferase MtaB